MSSDKDSEQRLIIEGPDNISPGTKRAINRLIYDIWDTVASWHGDWYWHVDYTDKGWELVFKEEPTYKTLEDLSELLCDATSLLCTCATPYKFSGKVTSTPNEMGRRNELRAEPAVGFILAAVEPEVKEVTMTEVCKKFGCTVKIVEA